MKKVTDKGLLEQLNQQEKEFKSPLDKPIKKLTPDSALKTFGKSAFRAAPTAIGNLMMKLGLTTPEIMQEAIEGKRDGKILHDEGYEQGQMAHPIADFAGGMAGFGPVGLGTSAAFRSVPMISRAMEAAAPSLLKRSAVHGLEGAAMGGMYSPEGHEGEGMLMGGLLGAGIGGPGVSIGKAIPGMRQRGKNIANLEELEGRHGEAFKAHEEQQAIIEALKNKYKEQGAGLGTPEDITRKIGEKQARMGELEPAASIPEENTSNLLNWPGGEELIPNAMNEKNMGLKEMEHYLKSGIGEGKTADVEAANEVSASIKKMKQHIQKNYYEPVEEYTSKNYVQLPRTADIKQIEEQLAKISSDPQFKNSPGFEKLKQEMIKMGGGHDLVPANDFVKQWKETKQAASRARRKGFQEGGQDQAYWQDQAASLKELANKQLQILEHHLPKQYYDKLIGADKLWKEEVAPFYGNKIYEQVKKLGRIDVANIPKELRGTGMGQEKMLELFLANPKLSRLALAHSHAKNPEGLLTAAPHEQAFIERLPALQGMMERLKSHNRNIEIAKAQTQRLQANRARVEEGHEELVKQQVQRQKAVKERAKLDREIQDLHSKRETLKQEHEAGKIKKAEFDRLDKEYKDALEAKNKVKKAIKFGLTIIGAGGISKLLS